MDEISLIVLPTLTGKENDGLFANISKAGKIGLELIKCEELEKDYIWLVYRIKHTTNK